MQILRNSFSFEKNADIRFPGSYDNDFLISINFSSCQLSFETLIDSLGYTYAFSGRPRNFTKIQYAWARSL